MCEFIMLVGLPGSGKSTYAKSLLHDADMINGVTCGYTELGEPIVWLSSDNLREYNNFEPGKGSAEVFEKMSVLMKANLKKGISVIYDATNLSRKRRIATIESIKKFDCYKRCVVFTEPIEEVKRRNLIREDSKWVVSESVIDRMLRNFQVPMEQEGFDDIELVQTVSGPTLLEFLAQTQYFNQDNSHHELDLYSHLLKSVSFFDLLKEKYGPDEFNLLSNVALYHDIGKLLTKDFHNAKGELTQEAHYYGHENVGAYLYLTATKDESFDDELYSAQLINWHMRAYQLLSEKKFKHELNFIGSKMYADLTLLHLADQYAH